MSADFNYPRQRKPASVPPTLMRPARHRRINPPDAPDAADPAAGSGVTAAAAPGMDSTAAVSARAANGATANVDTRPAVRKTARNRESSKPMSTTAVVTMLTPSERTRVDAAGDGCYTALHRDSLDEVMADLRLCRAEAVLVSVARCNAQAASSVARLVREFPTVPAVALWCDTSPDSAHAVLALGHYGVQSLVDARDPSGWRALRQLFTLQRDGSIERRSLIRLAGLLGDAPEDCRRFLEACFTSPARVGTVRQLARRLGVRATTLMSRFYRAQLPAPKRYLSLARLVRAAALFENPGMSITQVANTLEYSSPQSFGRHIHTMIGVTAVEFRREFTGARMLERFVDDLIAPQLDVLRRFRPLVILPTFSRDDLSTTAVLPTALLRHEGIALGRRHGPPP